MADPPGSQPQVCHSTASKTYQVTDNHGQVLVGIGQPIAPENDGNTVATISKTFSITGSTTMSASVTGGADVGVDLDVVKLGVSGSVTGAVVITIGGTESITGGMAVRPHKTGYVQGGVFRVVTDGQYTAIDTICNTTNSEVKAYSPHLWGFVVTGG